MAQPVWYKPSTRYANRRRVVGGMVAAGAGLASAGLVSCSSKSSRSNTPGPAAQNSGGAPRSGGTYTDFSNINPPTFDPQRTPSVATIRCACAVMSRLFRFKPVADPVAQDIYDVQADLAASGESPDAMTWTVKLRPDARFQNVAPVNGHAVEAEDIKVSFSRALGPENLNRGSFDMLDPAGIETPAKDTIVFKLKYPYADFKNTLANPQLSLIFAREIASPGYDSAKRLIGSGPFLLDSYTPDVAVVFKRNPDWFERGKPYVDGVRLAIIPDQAQALAQFSAGNLGAIAVQERDRDTVSKQNAKAGIIKSWAGGGSIVYFQMGDPASPFQDIRARRAASLEIDRAAIGKAVWNDQYEDSFNVERQSGKWALRLKDLDSPTAQWYKYDLTHAKDLLTQAGLANMPFKLEYPEPGTFPWSDTFAQLLYNMLAQLPWKLSLASIDFNKDYIGGGKGARYGNYPSTTLVSTSLQSSTTADDYLFKNFHSQSTSSASRVHDSAIDAMIAKERTIVNDEERLKAVLDIQRYIAGQMYTLAGLPHGYTYTLVSPKVSNYLSGETYGVGTSTWAQLWLNQ